MPCNPHRNSASSPARHLHEKQNADNCRSTLTRILVVTTNKTLHGKQNADNCRSTLTRILVAITYKTLHEKQNGDDCRSTLTRISASKNLQALHENRNADVWYSTLARILSARHHKSCKGSKMQMFAAQSLHRPGPRDITNPAREAFLKTVLIIACKRHAFENN